MAEEQKKFVQRYRFRVVAPDGRELLSEVVHVDVPASHAQAADSSYPVQAIVVALKGKKQGQLQGEGAHAGKHQFAALALDYQVQSPRDRATGQPAGKRQHSPLAIVKEWGAATPQIFQALVTNEVLESVEIDCYGRSKEGKETLVHKLKLTNASVASIRQSGGAQLRPGDPAELETVAFVFEKIEQTSLPGGVVASDDWSSR